jgi:tRNA modification GTPase
VRLSATTGSGVEGLIAHLQGLMGYREGGEGAFTARRRHLEALRRADGHLAAAADHLSGSRCGELAAEELRLAQQSLGEITGEFSSDELLGRIFSSFCIGK